MRAMHECAASVQLGWHAAGSCKLLPFRMSPWSRSLTLSMSSAHERPKEQQRQTWSPLHWQLRHLIRPVSPWSTRPHRLATQRHFQRPRFWRRFRSW